MKKIQRKVFKIATAPQIRLFETMHGGSASMSGDRSERFNDPDPEKIYIGERSLGEYLIEAGYGAALWLRTFLRELDWSAFEAAYPEEGRAAYAPAGMIGLILYGLLRGVRSLRALEALARMDLGCMWVSGGITPDHAVIGRFIVRHREILSEEFFQQLTGAVLRRLKGKIEELAVDGTVVQAAASAYKTLKLEAVRGALKDAQAAAAKQPDDRQLAAKLEEMQQLAQVAEARAAARKAKGRQEDQTRVSRSEPEAVFQPLKHGSAKPSYKPSVAANAQRIIVAQAVEPSSETAVVEALIDQAEQVARYAAVPEAPTQWTPEVAAKPTPQAAPEPAPEVVAKPIPQAAPEPAPEVAAKPTPQSDVGTVAEPATEAATVQRLMADAGYFTDDVIQIMTERKIDFLCPQGSVQGSGSWDKGSEKFFAKSLFIYDESTDSVRCPAGEKLEPFERYAGNATAKAYVRYGTPACAGCSLRAQCTDSPSGRSVKRYPSDKRKDELRARMKLPDIRALYRRRQAWVEPVFGSLKLGQGLVRFLRRGLGGVCVEFALHAMAHNLGRLLALKRPSAPLCGTFVAFLCTVLAAVRRWLPRQIPPAHRPSLTAHHASCFHAPLA